MVSEVAASQLKKPKILCRLELIARVVLVLMIGRFPLLLVLAIPSLSGATEGLDRAAVVHVRATVALSPASGPALALICTEDGEDRTPRTPRPLTVSEADSLKEPGVALEDMWTSTGQAPVVCELVGHRLLVVQPPRGHSSAIETRVLPRGGHLRVWIEK